MFSLYKDFNQNNIIFSQNNITTIILFKFYFNFFFAASCKN